MLNNLERCEQYSILTKNLRLSTNVTYLTKTGWLGSNLKVFRLILGLSLLVKVIMIDLWLSLT